ncbi:hypothetical protein J2X68_008103 [Streptomyces sp. 3330]|uniref:hypothetical protein n=1 Tax=Streptomyces sp. 3330 TaxID=2817755 RepID=UPI0028642F46|nr:hypothetical protein [Streptomyces sp. 3330]MDR6981360.1 hypothetical protein [Streptomyces sp. 3330]
MPDITMACSYAPGSPIALLLRMAADVDDSSAIEQREDAETAAAYHAYAAYPRTIAQAVEPADWQGLSAADGGVRYFKPSAVAWLDGGLWLHHTLRITEHGAAADVLTLISPCTCGRYTDITVDSEARLLELLAELTAAGGRSVHNETTGDCHSTSTVARLDGPR